MKACSLIPRHVDLARASHRNDETRTNRRGTPIAVSTDRGFTAITVCDEIAAVDIAELSQRARGLIRQCSVLVVDLCDIDFLAVDALHALLALWSENAATPGPAPTRIMRICSGQFTVVLHRCG